MGISDTIFEAAMAEWKLGDPDPDEIEPALKNLLAEMDRIRVILDTPPGLGPKEKN
jgi:hypothetical protein